MSSGPAESAGPGAGTGGVPDVLAEIVESSYRRVAEQTRSEHLFHDALVAGSERGVVSVICEHKRASPSAGVIRSDLALEQVVGAYTSAGASAISILTEPTRFAGSLEDIIAARRVTDLPIIRKDFIVDAFQVYEAAVAGAAAILLIVAAFPGDAGIERLAGLQRLAGELGLDVLMEIHDSAELEVAQALAAPIIGINNRNLSTLKVDLQTTYDLRSSIPAKTVVVAESGFSEPAQIRALASIHADAVLIGEALMRAPDIAAATRRLTRPLD